MLIHEKALPKECDCSPAVHGNMPHWVHMDALWKVQNETALERARLSQDVNGCFAFIRAEEDRLAARAQELQQRGLEGIVERAGIWYGQYRERLEIVFASYDRVMVGA